MSGSSLLVSGVAPDQAGTEDSLSLSVWEVYSDAVILDWYITLSMKFRSVKYSQQCCQDHIMVEKIEIACLHKSSRGILQEFGLHKRLKCGCLSFLLTTEQFEHVIFCTSDE